MSAYTFTISDFLVLNGRLMNRMSYRDKKVISIGLVSEITGLSVRKIRYYEERKLIFPDRSKGGTRKYSFADVERLIDIANHIEDGLQTYEIKRMEAKRLRAQSQSL
jgi:DNA-binding transcriptional MerR regulator